MVQGEIATYKDLLGNLRTIFPDRVYIEISDPESASELVDLAKFVGIPSVVANPVYYLAPNQAGLQRTLSAIRLNTKIENLSAVSVAPNGAHWLSMAEMQNQYSHFQEDGRL